MRAEPQVTLNTAYKGMGGKWSLRDKGHTEHQRDYTPYDMRIGFRGHDLQCVTRADYGEKWFEEDDRNKTDQPPAKVTRTIILKLKPTETVFKFFGGTDPVEAITLRIQKGEAGNVEEDGILRGRYMMGAAGAAYTFDDSLTGVIHSPNYMELYAFLPDDEFEHIWATAMSGKVRDCYVTICNADGLFASWRPDGHADEIKILTHGDLRALRADEEFSPSMRLFSFRYIEGFEISLSTTTYEFHRDTDDQSGDRAEFNEVAPRHPAQMKFNPKPWLISITALLIVIAITSLF